MLIRHLLDFATAIANSIKLCPYEKYLHLCPQKACPFKHIETDKVPRLSLKVMLEQHAVNMEGEANPAYHGIPQHCFKRHNDLMDFEDAIDGMSSTHENRTEEEL